MSCHAAFHDVRAVEMRSPGGSDGPHRSLVAAVRSLVREVEEEGGRCWSRDILGLTWHLQWIVGLVLWGEMMRS